MTRSTICLAFMAHNEKPEDFVAMRRALTKRISCWSAVIDPEDTETIKAVQDAFSGIPGTVHRYKFSKTRGFLDFAKARNRMLDLARRQKTDYVLWLDPDDEFSGEIPDELTEPVYAFEHYGPGSAWAVNHLIRHDANVHWEGRVHEHLVGSKAKLLNPTIRRTTSGSATAGLVDSQFIPMLFDMIEQDPNDAHAWFYLAQSYKDTGKEVEAAAAYAKCAELGGWAPVVYWCYFQIAEITASIDDYLIAYNFRPVRVEALHRLAAIYNARGQYHVARLFASLGLDVPPSDDAMFVERWVEQYGLLMELATAQANLGVLDQAHRIWEYVLTLDSVQPLHRRVCEHNLLTKAAA